MTVVIGDWLGKAPSKSDRQIAKFIGVDHKTVGKIRREAEARGEIPHVEKRTDTKGRSQPAKKPKPGHAEVTEKIATAEPTNAKSWRLEVLAKDGRRFENGIRLATEEEIDVYRFLHIGNDFWKMYHEQHIVPVATYTFQSADEPNVQFTRKKNGKITHVLQFPHGGCGWFGWTEVTEVAARLRAAPAPAPAKPPRMTIAELEAIDTKTQH
jgi:hypothetical protein